ncbi:MAG TPA: hypothetical protein VIR27_10875 [Mycobacteriales bacterium]|jgi:hypothetical protein
MTTPAASAPPVISEFVVPTPNSVPFRITTGGDGTLWFTERDANRIGRVNLIPAARRVPGVGETARPGERGTHHPARHTAAGTVRVDSLRSRRRFGAGTGNPRPTATHRR